MALVQKDSYAAGRKARAVPKRSKPRLYSQRGRDRARRRQVGETQVGETRVVVLGKRRSGEYEAWLVTRRRPSLHETGWLGPCKLG